MGLGPFLCSKEAFGESTGEICTRGRTKVQITVASPRTGVLEISYKAGMVSLLVRSGRG